jgi:hypothetical protein
MTAPGAPVPVANRLLSRRHRSRRKQGGRDSVQHDGDTYAAPRLRAVAIRMQRHAAGRRLSPLRRPP